MGPLTSWALAAAGLGLLGLAGSPWWALVASAGLYAAAARRWHDLVLVAWIPAALATPLPTLLTLRGALALGGVALCALAWWRVPPERALLPLAAGIGVLAAVLASPVALAVMSSDLATGAQASALLAGALVGYAVLTRDAAGG